MADSGLETREVPTAASANIVHLLRTTQQVQYQLSQMADQKASMLMAASCVIFTVAIAQAKGAMAPPLLVLGGFALIAASFAVLAVLPATGGGAKGPPNLLFFGSFTRLGQEEFVDRLLAFEADEDVYRAMATDIYQNGCVLARKKYRLLGYAYRVFLAGLLASLLTFVGMHLA